MFTSDLKKDPSNCEWEENPGRAFFKPTARRERKKAPASEGGRYTRLRRWCNLAEKCELVAGACG